jgi:enhancing lycopene biosynthesis protein 2
MAKRVGVILAGCGHRDGSDVGEATIALLALDRMGADVVCAAPDQPQSVVANHLNGEVAPAKPPKRAVLAEAARLTRGRIVGLAALADRDLDALIIPGGQGVGYSLSSYAEKGELCEVHPDVARLLRAMLSAHKPIGVSSLAAILAARVLGPVAGVRLTLGSKHPPAAKHAAVMGADVRPCTVDDVVADPKARVISTPASMYDDAPLRQIALGMEKLVRAVVGLARDRSPRPVPPTTVPGAAPSA